MYNELLNEESLHEGGVPSFISNRHVNIFTDEEGDPHVYITENITSPVEYLGFIRLLNNVPKEVNVHVHFNTVGGDMNTTTQIVDAMKNCKARIIGYVEGGVYSAGTVMILACDDYVVADNSSFMCHYYSSGYGGKGQDLEAYADHVKGKYRPYFKKVYAGFLKKKEIKKLVDGTDIWIGADELRERLDKYKNYKIRQKAIELFESQDSFKAEEIERALSYVRELEATSNKSVEYFISMIKGEFPPIHEMVGDIDEDVVQEIQESLSSDEVDDIDDDGWVSLDRSKKTKKVKRNYKPTKKRKLRG